jgi:hypothetical protein
MGSQRKKWQIINIFPQTCSRKERKFLYFKQYWVQRNVCNGILIYSRRLVEKHKELQILNILWLSQKKTILLLVGNMILNWAIILENLCPINEI